MRAAVLAWPPVRVSFQLAPSVPCIHPHPLQSLLPLAASFTRNPNQYHSGLELGLGAAKRVVLTVWAGTGENGGIRF